ncbi:MAG: hypothetical protein DA408_16220, partial [Bacteroidetes bacterium]
MVDFADPALVTGPTLQNSSQISQLIFSGLPVGSGSFYVDNIYFSTSACPTAAPEPTCDAANVISMFSNAYMNVAVSTWLTPWSAAPVTLTDLQIAGNDTKFYQNVTFLGIETTGPNLIDASAMTTFHIDFWSGNATQFRIKLVDFGANMGFGGGDDTEHELTFTLPAQNTWVSYDIPLADFTGLLNRDNIAQLILSAMPNTVADFYIDNVYFSTCTSVVTTVPVEFCVDLACFAVSDAVALAGSFNNFNPGADFLMQDMGNRIYCKTIDLEPGDYDFMFFFAQEQFENLDVADFCTVNSPAPNGVARRITVVDGMPQQVQYGWETCDETCPAPVLTDVNFCVDLSCYPQRDAVAVAGSFNGFNPGANFMSDPDGDGIYCATVGLLAGDNTYKFFFAQGQFEDVPAECETPNGNRLITVVEGVMQNVLFEWQSCSPRTVPVLDFPALDAVCGDDLTVTFTGDATPAGGEYSGEGVTDNGDGTFDVDLAALAAGDYLITYTVQQLACEYTATSTLLVLDCAFGVTDPCDCNDDASAIVYDAVAGTYTNPNDGTFGEVVALTGPMGAPLPAGLDVRVVAVTGAIGVAVDAPLVYDVDLQAYIIAFNHADDLGYSMTVDLFIRDQELGYNLVVANTCAYPNPVFDPALDAIYCDFEAAIDPLGGFDPADVNGPASVTFTINGAAATAFNPTALGAGTYNVVMTYTGVDDGNNGLSPDGGATAAYRGCRQDVATTIIVRPLEAACVANLNVTLGANCSTVITPEMVLRGEFACADQINVTVDGGTGNTISGCGPHTYSVDIIVAGQIVYTCWGNILAEDKTDPVVVCPPNINSITRDYAAQIATGRLEATDASLNFQNYSCLSEVNILAGVHNYDLVTFTTPALPNMDIYTILVENNFAGAFFTDAGLYLFQGAFNPANPCENIIGSADDSFVPGVPDPFDPALRLSLPLPPNTTYTLLITNYDAAALGNWTASIYSDNGTQVGGGNFAATTVTDTRDLVCDDINGIRFTSPRNWIVNANGTLDATATRNTFFGGSQTALTEFLAKLSLTGIPVATDNCGQVLVTLTDAV